MFRAPARKDTSGESRETRLCPQRHLGGMLAHGGGEAGASEYLKKHIITVLFATVAIQIPAKNI